MDDTISRQAAIDSLEEERCPCESDYDEGYLSMLDKAIWIIKEWLPSAQQKLLKYSGESICVFCRTTNCDGCLYEPTEEVK